ncbi:MAG: hypothetical protein ACXVEF_00060 [Polyangiales bacterium]
MRGMLIVAFTACAVGCSSSDFVVAEGETDSGLDTGTIGSDVEGDTTVAETTAEDTAVPPDTTTPPDTTASDSSMVLEVGTDAIVVEIGPGDVGTLDATTGCDTNSDCAVGTFCFKVGCTVKGTCGPLPSGISNYGPVCGCDGVTYWNSFHAATFSVGVHNDGPCTGPDRKTCSAPGECPEFTNSECVFSLGDKASCSVAAPIGTCWRTPTGKICPVGKSGPPVSTCDGTCKTECDAIKLKAKFYVDTCTPT